MQGKKIVGLVISALEELKAIDIKTIDVSSWSNITDYMIIATGTSWRHVRSIAENVLKELKDNSGLQPNGIEGADTSDWVLVDLGDVIVHVMMADIREFYDLEKLWSDMDNEEQSGVL